MLSCCVLAGYDAAETNSIRVNVPDYRSRLRRSTSTLRVGVPRDFFFDDLDQEVDISTKKALAEIQMMTSSLRDVTLPYRASDLESARGVVRAAEAYVYHTEWVTKTPELYQPEKLIRIRAGADVTAPAYIRARREVAEARRAVERVFRGQGREALQEFDRIEQDMRRAIRPAMPELEKHLIEDPRVIRHILAHCGLPTDVPAARPPRAPPIRFEPVDDDLVNDISVP